MTDMVIELDAQGGRHLYEQIYDYVRQEIREGRLSCGERLPSTRSLAEFLQVSRSTVDLAYEQLLSEGYIEARPYKGFFVCRIEGLYDLQRVQEEQKERTEYERPHFRFDFSPNVIEPEGFPLGVWKRIVRETLIDENRELYTRGNPQGDIGLREAICHFCIPRAA